MIEKKIEALVKLGKWMLSQPDKLELAKLKSKRDNAWFDLAHQQMAIESLAVGMLQEEHLNSWLSNYEQKDSQPKRVGLIPAGNIPAVGFHDLLCIYMSPHTGNVKLSDKDAHLLPAIFDQLSEYDPAAKQRIQFVDKLVDIDAIIATGSNNSKRYFEYYFGHLPHIIRGNRNSLAVIDQSAEAQDLEQLGKDVFEYYGLGCRSVSQILIPEDYNENLILDQWENYQYVIENTKYENNFKYNYATSIMNREEFKTNNFLILKESSELVSRIACVHLHRYSKIEDAIEYINQKKDQIQVCVSNIKR